MLAFIGFIALLIFGKFLWDTYVTGKTEKDWQAYKQNEPEKAARIVNSTTFDISTDYKPNPIHQQISLNMIAALFNCDASQAKEAYKKVKREELAIDFGNIEKFKEEIKEVRQHKYKQATSMKFDPNDTPAAFMEGWIQEAIAKFIQPEISVERVISKAYSLTCKYQYKDALELLSASYKMIQSGELVDNNNLMPFVLNAIGENHLSLEENSKAWLFFSEAISHIKETSPDNKEALNKFLLNKKNAESNTSAVAESVLEAFDRESRLIKPKINTEDLLMEASALASENQHEEVLKLVANIFVMIASGEITDDSNDTDNLVSFLFNARAESLMVLNKFDKAYLSFEYAITNFKNINQENENILRKIIKRKISAYDKTDKSVVFSNPIQEALEAKDAAKAKLSLKGSLAGLKFKKSERSAPVDNPITDSQKEDAISEVSKDEDLEAKTKVGSYAQALVGAQQAVANKPKFGTPEITQSKKANSEAPQDAVDEDSKAQAKLALKGAFTGVFKKYERNIFSNPTEEEPKLFANEDDESVV